VIDFLLAIIEMFLLALLDEVQVLPNTLSVVREAINTVFGITQIKIILSILAFFLTMTGHFERVL